MAPPCDTSIPDTGRIGRTSTHPCGNAHGFYVRYTKFQTVDERNRVLREANLVRARYVEQLQHGLARVCPVQPADAGEIPHDLS